jgi:hypothetical protein
LFRSRTSNIIDRCGRGAGGNHIGNNGIFARRQWCRPYPNISFALLLGAIDGGMVVKLLGCQQELLLLWLGAAE